jgi:hypothetical protein
MMLTLYKHPAAFILAYLLFLAVVGESAYVLYPTFHDGMVELYFYNSLQND